MSDVSIRTLGTGVGAEVRGVDLSRGIVRLK